MGYPMCSPLQYQLPGLAIRGGTWFSLALLGFDQVKFTAVADEHLIGNETEVLEFIPLIEPDELPDCSTPRQDAAKRREETVT